VIATHGTGDEAALERVLAREAGYVSLVASRKRAAAVLENLRAGGLSPSRIDRLKAPAGLDIGAATPEEIAVSILAEIVQARRSAKPTLEAEGQEPAGASASQVDPVCRMLVEVSSAAYRAEAMGQVFYFCCAGCKAAFERDPERYAAPLAG
jgi:xanthine dehydrogenase accessory factor